MDYVLLPADLVADINGSVLDSVRVAERTPGKSLKDALVRVENRMAYGLIDDAFDLAAAYCFAVAQSHCFNDGNKRMAFRVMDAALAFNGRMIPWNTEETGQIIIRVAQGLMDEGALADWLRGW